MDKIKELKELAIKLEQIVEPIAVYDTGLELFGFFPDGKQAAYAIRTSRIDWWAMQEPPNFELIKDIELEDWPDWYKP